jgi:hypothetical protein
VRTAECMPAPMLAALRELLGEVVEDVLVVERSWYARLHGPVRATTRRNRILLRGSRAEFFADPELVLHEYFHVVRQWNRGRLSVSGYLRESLRNGYWLNRYERQARRFAARRLPALRSRLGHLADACPAVGGHAVRGNV